MFARMCYILLKNKFIFLSVVLSTIIVFYFLLYAFSKNSIAGNPKENWNGLALSFILTVIAIPAFSIVLMSICSIKTSCLLYTIGIAIFNSISCATLLYIVFFINDVSPLTEGFWYVKYPGFILFLSIVISLLAFMIKKLKVR